MCVFVKISRIASYCVRIEFQVLLNTLFPCRNFILCFINWNKEKQKHCQFCREVIHGISSIPFFFLSIFTLNTNWLSRQCAVVFFLLPSRGCHSLRFIYLKLIFKNSRVQNTNYGNNEVHIILDGNRTLRKDNEIKSPSTLYKLPKCRFMEIFLCKIESLIQP